jgi:CRP/FNR family transcriptional regulator, transcriptional activator FtrB
LITKWKHPLSQINKALRRSGYRSPLKGGLRDMRAADVARIRRSKLLAEVPARELIAMLAGCFVQALPEGTVLCRPGEKARFVHVVVSGRVGLFGKAADKEALIEIFGRGDAFIVPAVLLDAPYLVTVRLLDEGRILMWPADSFRSQARTNGSLAFGAALQLSGYWRTLVGQIKDLKLLSAIERLSTFLLAHAPRAPGPVIATLPGGRRLVASWLGVTPQSLSRAFAALRPLGVTGGGRQISIADPVRLRRRTQRT